MYKFSGGVVNLVSRDASAETASVVFRTVEINGANYDAMEGLANQLYTGVFALQHTNTVLAKVSLGNIIYGATPLAIPGNAACQREAALRVYANDVGGNSFTFSIPCADWGGQDIVAGGGDWVDISGVDWTALSALLQSGPFRSPYGLAIDGITKVKIIGRRN